MSPAVTKAIAAITAQFGRDGVHVAPDRDGGAYVIVEGVPLGAPFTREETWIGFHIPSTCPYADVYPHFVRPDLARIDGAALGEGLSASHTFPDQAALKTPGTLPARTAVQVSRRSNGKDSAGLETPLHKLLKVLQWLKSR
ncbi:hypothetical protein ACMDCR_28295 [Labrys okinawensis]|uniref:hypothetical protein n=1 Tax=Labrys okinawensis TaxID=346911 RepID=UPI0039BCD6B7